MAREKGGKWRRAISLPYFMDTRWKQIIEEAYSLDQEIRRRILPGKRKSSKIPIENIVYYLVDKVHNLWLKECLKKYDYPKELKILDKFWVLIMHQWFDPEFQRECLKKCKFTKDQKLKLCERIEANRLKFKKISGKSHVVHMK